MAAAVSDYTPAHPSTTKLKKQSAKLTLELKPTPDILKWAGRHRRVCTAHRKPQIVVGFALEDRDVVANAEKKMRDKHLDMIVANTPAAIGADHLDLAHQDRRLRLDSDQRRRQDSQRAGESFA